MKEIKVIVFDLYNTLMFIKNSKHFFVKLYKASTNGFNMNLHKYLNVLMTTDLQEVILKLPLEFKQLYIENIDVLAEELSSVTVYDDVFKELRCLSEIYRICLISNLASPYKEPVFTTKLNEFLEEMIFSCDFGFMKPNSVIFREIENRCNVQSNEILMVGDSFKSDILGAKKAGWHSLRLNRNNSFVLENDIQNLKDLKQMLSKF